MPFSKSIALACFAHVITAQYIDCTNDTCSDTNIECSDSNITTCTIDCIGDFACDKSVIYGGSGDLALNCDGTAACRGVTVYCPYYRICNISVPDGAVPDYVYASSSSELLVTVSEDLRPTLSTIHCPLPFISNGGLSTQQYPCALWIDGENGDNCCGNDVYTIYSNDTSMLTVECLNLPCHSHVRTIHLDKTHTSICILEPSQQFGGYNGKKMCFNIDIAEGEPCTHSSPQGYELETIEITSVSEGGKYFHFDNDWCDAGVYEIAYEGEWIPVMMTGICKGNVTMHRYPLRTAAAGDWELGSFKRMRPLQDDTFHPADSCGDGLQCVSSTYPSTCQAITTPSPTDNSANGYSFLFSVIITCLFCFIL